MWAGHTAKTLARAAIDYEPVGLAGSPQRPMPCIGGAAVAVGQVYRDRLGRQRRRPLRRYIHAPALRRRCARALPLPQVSVPALSCCQLRSEEHTSELQSLMRISYAVFCLNKKKQQITR